MSRSSLRNAVKRREHKERAQPAERRRLGLLEKHKDYVQRARNYNRKRDALQVLKEKAALRNPDEFYFGMINSKSKNGVHIPNTSQAKTYSPQELHMMKTQDIGYVQMKRQREVKKIESLKQSLSLNAADVIAAADQMSPVMGNEDPEYSVPAPSENKQKRQGRHTVFVETAKEKAEFKPADFFDTEESMVDRRFNRLRKSQLEKINSRAKENGEGISKKAQKARALKYKELEDRLVRESKLKRSLEGMDLAKKLMEKGNKRKIHVGTDEDGMPIYTYKWKQDRQR